MEIQAEMQAAAARAVEFGLFALGVFRDAVLANPGYVELITTEAYTHRTHYMGPVDPTNKVNFYDGTLRVVDPDGAELLRFDASDYLEHIAAACRGRAGRQPQSVRDVCGYRDDGRDLPRA